MTSTRLYRALILSVGIAALLTTTGSSTLAAPSKGNLTCQADVTITADSGVFLAGPAKDVTLTTQPTTAHCVDTRAEITDDNRITSVTASLPSPARASGTCLSLTATATATLTWTLANGAKLAPSTLKLTAAITNGDLNADAHIIDGPFTGAAIDGAVANLSSVAQKLLADCSSSTGAKTLAGHITVTIS